MGLVKLTTRRLVVMEDGPTFMLLRMLITRHFQQLILDTVSDKKLALKKAPPPTEWS